MKYHQVLNQISKKQNKQILDWAFNNATYFSLVWQPEFKFKKNARKIGQKLEKHLERTELTNEWPGTKVYGPRDTKINFYRITKRTSKIIKSVGSIFQWVAPEYPEDLAFYNHKLKPLFGSVAHENLAFIIGKQKIVTEALKMIKNLEIKTLT